MSEFFKTMNRSAFKKFYKENIWNVVEKFLNKEYPKCKSELQESIENISVPRELFIDSKVVFPDSLDENNKLVFFVYLKEQEGSKFTEIKCEMFWIENGSNIQEKSNE